jgi:RES domain-containing protein
VPRVAVWRIARRVHALDRLGTGARQNGGRWNHPETPAIYAGATIAIAAMETYVHVSGVVPPDLVLVRIELPDGHSSEKPALRDLPAGWDLLPPGPASMDFGTRWARGNRSLALYVPSVLVPEERNAVINPGHAEFGAVRMAIERDFRFDVRMYEPRRGPKVRRR